MSVCTSPCPSAASLAHVFRQRTFYMPGHRDIAYLESLCNDSERDSNDHVAVSLPPASPSHTVPEEQQEEEQQEWGECAPGRSQETLAQAPAMPTSPARVSAFMAATLLSPSCPSTQVDDRSHQLDQWSSTGPDGNASLVRSDDASVGNRGTDYHLEHK